MEGTGDSKTKGDLVNVSMLFSRIGGLRIPLRLPCRNGRHRGTVEDSSTLNVGCWRSLWSDTTWITLAGIMKPRYPVRSAAFVVHDDFKVVGRS